MLKQYRCSPWNAKIGSLVTKSDGIKQHEDAWKYSSRGVGDGGCVLDLDLLLFCQPCQSLAYPQCSEASCCVAVPTLLHQPGHHTQGLSGRKYIRQSITVHLVHITGSMGTRSTFCRVNILHDQCFTRSTFYKVKDPFNFRHTRNTVNILQGQYFTRSTFYKVNILQQQHFTRSSTL